MYIYYYFSIKLYTQSIQQVLPFKVLKRKITHELTQHQATKNKWGHVTACTL